MTTTQPTTMATTQTTLPKNSIISLYPLNQTNRENKKALFINIKQYRLLSYKNYDDSTPNLNNIYKSYIFDGNSYIYLKNNNLTFFLTFLFRINNQHEFTLLESKNLLIKYEIEGNAYNLNVYIKSVTNASIESKTLMTSNLDSNYIYKLYISCKNTNENITNYVKNEYSISLINTLTDTQIASDIINDTHSSLNQSQNNIYLGTGINKNNLLNGELGYIIYSSEEISSLDYVIDINFVPNNNFYIKQKIHPSNFEINTIPSIQNIDSYYNSLYQPDLPLNYSMPTKELIIQPITQSTYENNSDEYMVKVFTLKSAANEISQNKNYIYKLNFISLNELDKIMDKYDDVQLVLYGDKNDTYLYPLLKCSNLIVIVIYKINNEYKFELIPIDLDLFYEYNHRYALKMYQDSNNIDTFWSEIESFTSQRTNNYEYNIFNGLGNNTMLNINIGVSTRQNSIFVNTYYIIQNPKEAISQEGCSFTPYGDTIQQCRLICNNENTENNCTSTECNIRCKGCQHKECKWNITKIIKKNMMKPESASIKGFSGRNTIKITWVKPDSPFDITKYYIILTKNDVNDPNFLQIHNIEDSRDLLDYYILDLQNDIIYNVFLISKNKHGVSEKSNVISIIPNEDGDDFGIKKKNSYSNSLQNYYNMSEKQYQTQLSLFEKQVVYNDIKDILIEDLKFKEPKGVFNINII